MATNDEIIRLLKHGRSEEVRLYVDEQKKTNYPEDFSIFMEQMLDQYHVKRKDIAIRSGLSQDYTYKLLRGAKKTKERDYILAICIAVGMNIVQTQHALAVYGMPMLDNADLRSHVIYLGIENHLDMDGINDWLEKSGFVYIKTSPDMPSAKIELRMQEQNTEEGIIEETHRRKPALSSVNHEYEEISRNIQAEHCGNAPMDYNYWGVIAVQDENGKKYYIEASYTRYGDILYVLDEENYKKNQDSTDLSEEDEIEIMEQYGSLVEAGTSDFFRFFLALDQATDEKVTETMAYIDDTRNYGIRVGAGMQGDTVTCYLEAFNTQNPADREYLQIVQTNGEYTFSASRESYFLRIEMGDMYPFYFGEKREPEYFLKVNKTSDLTGDRIRLRFTFDELLLTMHQYANEHFGGVFDTDDKDINDEMIQAHIQRATWYVHGNQYAETVEELQQAVDLMEEAEEAGGDYTIPLIVTYSKMAITYGNMGDHDKMISIYSRLYLMKDRIERIPAGNDEGKENAIASIAEAMINKAQYCQNMRGQYDPEARMLAKEAIDLLEDNCTSSQSWGILFMAYTKYSYIIDVEEPELAVRYCHKAVQIVNAYHLDHNDQYRHLVYALYNNYAWVLWNNLGSEEAIIYYGRAIELEESLLFLNTEDKKTVLANLAHVGDALLRLYEATNKKKEAERLISRLTDDGLKMCTD